MIREENSFRGGYSKDVLQTLWFAYRKSAAWILSFIFFGFIGRGMLLASANLVGAWADDLAKLGALTDNHHHVVVIMTTVGIGFMMTFFFRIGFSNLSARAVSRLYDEVTLRTSRFAMPFFDHQPVGRIVTRFSSDYGNVFRLFGGPLAEFLSIIFDLFWMILLTSFASPYYLPFIVGLGVVNYFLYRKNRDNLRLCRRELARKRSPSIAHFAETAQGSSTIRSFQKQKIFASRFAKLDQMYLAQKKVTTKAVIRFALQLSITSASLYIALAGISILLLHYNLATIGAVGVALGFVTLSSSTIQMFFEWLTQFEEAIVGVERLDHYLRAPIENGSLLPHWASFPTGHPQAKAPEASEATTAFPTNAAVRFEHMSFRYVEDGPWILRDIDFQLKAGEKLGIIGRTGAGKTTLIQALFNLYPLTEGKIYVEEKGPPELDLEQYRRHFSLISQDAAIFQSSLRDNLTLDPKITDKLLLETLERIGLSRFASKEGLNFPVEEKGRNLSSGEKQLICLARCLLSKTPVVIFDEATSHIDPKTEARLVVALKDDLANRTQILIAHRLSTLQGCDKILWLHQGKIEMIGEAKEVLEKFQAANLATTGSASDDVIT